MTSRAQLLASLGPEWLPHRYDPDRDCFHFRNVDRKLRQTAPFLTDEYLPQSLDSIVIDRQEAADIAHGDGRIHFIFHSAYCCSTVLADALDQPGLLSSLKEPVVLNDLVGWRHRGGDPQRITQVLHSSLRLLARTLVDGEAAIVKPSNAVNGLASAILNARPDAHAILLHAPIEAYLTSIARKGMWGRLWVRELLALQLKDGLIDLGFKPQDYLMHTDLQVAAVGWLAQHKLFSALSERWPDRVRTLSSEQLTEDPIRISGDCATFFGAQGACSSAFQNRARKAFARNAKDGSSFKTTDRIRDRIEGEKLHREEIEKVVMWAQAVARAASISMALPNGLADLSR